MKYESIIARVSLLVLTASGNDSVRIYCETLSQIESKRNTNAHIVPATWRASIRSLDICALLLIFIESFYVEVVSVFLYIFKHMSCSSNFRALEV